MKNVKFNINVFKNKKIMVPGIKFIVCFNPKKEDDIQFIG